ncbi:MAG: extracellular solute-binding protein [Chloroflexi bacterium]|nr:extracellular solute-binding protein [Chloroflexota bacterium]
MNKHNFFRLAITVMLLSILMTACGAPASPTQVPAAGAPTAVKAQPTVAPTQAMSLPPGQAAQATKAPEPTTAAQPMQPGESPNKKYAGTKLVVSWPSLSHFQNAAKMIPDFTKETGIQVEVDFTEYAKLKDKQVLELSKATGDYDVVAWTVFEKGEYVAKGLLTPMSQYFAMPALVDPDYDPEDIAPAFLLSGSVVGGKKGYLPGVTQGLYGIPFGPETSILAYRKDIFEQYKLKVPETYDEMLQTAEWINKNVPNMKGLTSRGQSGHQIVHAYLLHLSPLGGQIFDDKWNPVFNNDAGLKAAETLKKIIELSPAGVNNYDFGAEANAFLQGQAAMYVDAHKIAAMSRDPKQSKVDGKVGYALHPKGKTGLAETGGQAMGIAANSKKKEAAFLFIQWMTSKKADKKVVELGGDPIRKSTFGDPELQKKYPEYPVIVKQLETANADWRPLIPEWQSINAPILGVELSEFVTGKKTAKQALDDAANKVRAEMDRAGYYSFGANTYKKYAGTKIVVSWPSLSHFQNAAKMVPDFTKETGIQVEVDFAEYTKLKDKQVLELSKATGDYDVVAWTVFEKGEYVAKGLLAPMSQYFAMPALVDPNYDADDIAYAFIASGAIVGGKKGYLPGPTQALYGVPFGPETSILAYRKDIFEQNKLKVPETYDEMLQTAEWISKNVPNMKGMTSRGQSGHQIVAAWLLHLSPYGGLIFDDKWNPVFNNDAGLKAAETTRKILDNSPAGVTNYDFGAAANAFLQGNAAMWVDAHKIAAMSRDPKQSKVDGKVGYALHPKDKTCLSETGGQAMGIAANSKKKEAAFLFIQWITSKAQDKKVVELGGDPIRKSTFGDAALQIKFPEYPVIVKQLECAAVDWRPLIPEWQAINAPIIGVELSEYVTGKKTAKQALDDAANKVRQDMTRAGYYSWTSK